MTDYLTDADVAEQIGKAREFVQDQCRRGIWPHHRFGKSYRFTADDLAAIADLTKVTPAAPTEEPEQSWGLAPGRRSA